MEDGVKKLASHIDGVDESKPVDNVLTALESSGALDSNGGDAVRHLLDLREQALRGTPVNADVKDWVQSEGQQLPRALDILAEEAREG